VGPLLSQLPALLPGGKVDKTLSICLTWARLLSCYANADTTTLAELLPRSGTLVQHLRQRVHAARKPLKPQSAAYYLTTLLRLLGNPRVVADLDAMLVAAATTDFHRAREGFKRQVAAAAAAEAAPAAAAPVPAQHPPAPAPVAAQQQHQQQQLQQPPPTPHSLTILWIDVERMILEIGRAIDQVSRVGVGCCSAGLRGAQAVVQ
jgi:hypothetical protein